MTRFQNGPAKGQTLMLKRAPIFLRVIEANGKFHALDQSEDVPYPSEKFYPSEKLYAYTIVNKPKCRGPYVIADYRLYELQPPEDMMRNEKLWKFWCRHHPLMEDLQ